MFPILHLSIDLAGQSQKTLKQAEIWGPFWSLQTCQPQFYIFILTVYIVEGALLIWAPCSVWLSKLKNLFFLFIKPVEGNCHKLPGMHTVRFFLLRFSSNLKTDKVQITVFKIIGKIIISACCMQYFWIYEINYKISHFCNNKKKF